MSKFKKNKWVLIGLLVAFFLVGFVCCTRSIFFDNPSQLVAAEKKAKTSSNGKSLAVGDPEVTKTVTPVPGMINQWDVKVRVESKVSPNKNGSNVVVLVLDNSASMKNNGKLDKMKQAAKEFVDNYLYTGSSNKLGIVFFGGGPYDNYVQMYDESERLEAKKKINDILPAITSGRNIQMALNRASNLYEEEANKNNSVVPEKRDVLLITDGAANYSYKITGSYIQFDHMVFVPELSHAGLNVYETSDQIDDVFIPIAWGDGQHVRTDITDKILGVPSTPPTKVMNNAANSAVAESTIFKNKTHDIKSNAYDGQKYITKLYTVGIDLDQQTEDEDREFAGSSLKKMATSPNEYTSIKSDELNTYMRKFLKNYTNPDVKNVVVNDLISPGFELEKNISGEIDPNVSKGSLKVSQTGNSSQIEWNIGDLEDVVSSDPSGTVASAEMTYRVSAISSLSSLVDDANSVQVGKQVSMKYADKSNVTKEKDIESPRTKATVINVRKKLLGLDGQEVTTSDKSFGFELKKADSYDIENEFSAKAGKATKVIVSCPVGTAYSIKEYTDPKKYSTKVMLDDGKEVDDQTIDVKISNPNQNHTITFINKELDYDEEISKVGEVLIKKTITPIAGVVNKWKVNIRLVSRDDSAGNTVQNVTVTDNIAKGFTVEGGTNQEDATSGDIAVTFKGKEVIEWKVGTLLNGEPDVPGGAKRFAEMNYILKATGEDADNINDNDEISTSDQTLVEYTDLNGAPQQVKALNEKVKLVVVRVQNELLDENGHQIIDSAHRFKIDVDGIRVPITSIAQRNIVRLWKADKVYKFEEILDDPDAYETSIEVNGRKIKGTTYDLKFSNPLTSQTIKIINKRIKKDDGKLVPGEVKVDKKAVPVAGTVNQWDVTLRVDSMDEFPPPTSDIVLVLDNSGSMKKAGRMEKAKEAAKLFVNTILQEGYQNKIALVSFSDDVQVHQVPTESGGTSVFSTPKEKDKLINVIDSIEVVDKGATFTQGGIKVARDILKNEEEGKALPALNRQIILISDGAATFSYGLKPPYNSIRKAVFDPDFPINKWSSIYADRDPYLNIKNVPEKYIDYSNKVGQGAAGFNLVIDAFKDDFPGFEIFDPLNDQERMFIFSPIYAAINESTFAKLQRMKNGDNLLTSLTSVAVDFSEGESGNFKVDYTEKKGLESLKEIASSDEDFFSVKSDDISGVLNKIAEDIILSAKEASFKDPIGKGFKIIGTPKATNGSVTVDDGQTIDWEIGNVSTVLDSDGKTKHRYEEITYRVEATPDVLKEMDKDGTAPTNGKTILSYVGTDNHNERLEAIVPKVKPMIVSVQKKLFDAYGNEVTSSSEPFHFQINHGSLVDKTFDLKPGSTTKIVQPWEIGTTYSVSELLAPSQQSEYETSVVTNGAEMQGATTYFKIDSADDIKDQTLLFKNKVYSKKKSLYIRQCVINTNNELVIPSKGYYSATFGDDKQLPLLSESTTKDTSEEVNSKIFTKYQLKLESATKNKLNIKDYIPEYYKLFGSVVTTDSNNLNMLHLSSNPAINKSDKIQLDYGENDENWVTIFIEPSLKKVDGGSDTPVEPPQPYSWSYKTNIFGK